MKTNTILALQQRLWDDWTDCERSGIKPEDVLTGAREVMGLQISDEQIARDKAPSIVAQRYVNTKDAAKYLGVSFPTFKKWVEEKNIYPVVIAGAKRWDKQDLDNELEREKSSWNTK